MVLRIGILRALSLIGAIVGLACALLTPGVRADLALMAAWLVLLLGLLVAGRRHWLGRFAVASLVAVVWVGFARERYAYNHNYLVVAGVNLFPLFAWGTGLFAVYAVFRIVAGLLPELPPGAQFALFAGVYWLLLVTFEVLGYNAFGIRNLAQAGRSALPGLPCMHMPAWMRAVYFALGPAFYLLCEFLPACRRPAPVPAGRESG